jgi:hypothetical protein
VASGLAPVQTGDIVYISNRGHGLQANTHDQEVTDHALEPRVPSQLFVASELPVVSGLAPRWAAQQPQSSRMRCVRNYSVDGFGAATQPNAGQARSPQEARSPQRIHSSQRHCYWPTLQAYTRNALDYQGVHVVPARLSVPAHFLWRTIIPCGERACPALGCAAAPIQQNAVCQELLREWLWGRYAAQRGASPLTTGSLLATTNPFATNTLLPAHAPGVHTGHIGLSRWPCCACPTSIPQPTFCGERSSLVVSGLVPRWAAQQPQSSRMRCVRNYSGNGFGAATQPNAGQARSPQEARSPIRIHPP